jgi:hypothetical protein
MEDRPFNFQQIDRPLAAAGLASALTWGACVCDSAAAQELGGFEMNRGASATNLCGPFGVPIAQQWGWWRTSIEGICWRVRVGSLFCWQVRLP